MQQVEYVCKTIVTAYDPGATGVFYPCVVPPDEFWECYTIYCKRVAGATLTIDGLWLKDPRTGENAKIGQATAAALQFFDYTDGEPIKLPPNFTLGISIAAHAGGDTYSVIAYYKRTKYI